MIQLTRASIDLGIVTSNRDAALHFYCDVLGFVHEADIPMALGRSGTMHRLRCGDAVIKLIKFDEDPTASNPSGGIAGALGLRYFSVHVSNVDEVFQACIATSAAVVAPITVVRPGVRVAVVEDPDGNIVEFVQTDPV